MKDWYNSFLHDHHPVKHSRMDMDRQSYLYRWRYAIDDHVLDETKPCFIMALNVIRKFLGEDCSSPKLCACVMSLIFDHTLIGDHDYSSGTVISMMEDMAREFFDQKLIIPFSRILSKEGGDDGTANSSIAI